jgi:hypothetical protein
MSVPGAVGKMVRAGHDPSPTSPRSLEWLEDQWLPGKKNLRKGTRADEILGKGRAEQENRSGPPCRFAAEGTRSAVGWGRLRAARAQGA